MAGLLTKQLGEGEVMHCIKKIKIKIVLEIKINLSPLK